MWVLSLVMTLPNGSSSLTTGWVAKATPAVAVADGCVVMTSWLAAAGLTTTLLDVGREPAGVGGEGDVHRLGLVVGQAAEGRHAARTVPSPWLPLQRPAARRSPCGCCRR